MDNPLYSMLFSAAATLSVFIIGFLIVRFFVYRRNEKLWEAGYEWAWQLLNDGASEETIKRWLDSEALELPYINGALEAINEHGHCY